MDDLGGCADEHFMVFSSRILQAQPLDAAASKGHVAAPADCCGWQCTHVSTLMLWHVPCHHASSSELIPVSNLGPVLQGPVCHAQAAPWA
jgi:hypothetical protein